MTVLLKKKKKRKMKENEKLSSIINLFSIDINR